MASTTAIVLAAGAGTRFGGAKQLAEVRGVPLIKHAVRAAEHPDVARTLVVLGARADEIRPTLADERVDVLECPRWAEGLAASLRTGLDEAGDEGPVLVLLADQPGVTSRVVARVLAHGDEGDAVRATYLGRPSHPVLLLPRILPRLSGLSGDRGAMGVLATADVRLVPCDDIGFDGDVDTPADLRAVAERFGAP